MSSLTFCHPAILQFLIVAVFFVIDRKELKLAQTAKINQLFQFLNQICIYSYVFYRLTRTLMRKNTEPWRHDESINQLINQSFT